MEEREKIALRLKEAGVDVDGAVARFMGNWSLFYRFLRKFPARGSLYFSWARR